MQTIQIYFDGGCRPSNPGNKYGSYEVLMDGVNVHTVSEQEFGFGTNNEAEFESLLSALEWTLKSLVDYGYSPSQYRLSIFTDSMIVRNRISGQHKSNRSEPQQRMSALTRRCHDWIEKFGGMEIVWQPREANVERFGH